MKTKTNRWVLRAALVSVILGVAAARADQTDEQTGVSGTAADDVINQTDPLGVTAAVATGVGETITASATGIDSLAGNDSVTAGAAIDTTAAAAAAVIDAPGETEASASSTGVAAGDDDDSVQANSEITATSTSAAAYAGALDIEYDDESSGGAKEVNVSVTSTSESTGIDGGDGHDTVDNAGPLSATAVSTSGGSADQLDATLSDSATLEATSVSNATATGIGAGGGGDLIENSGTVDSSATAVSGALAVGVTAGDAADPEKKTQVELEASATATATATGIASDPASDVQASSVTLSFGIDGLTVTYSNTVTTDSADDTLVNFVRTTATATAVSGAGAGGLSSAAKGNVDAKTNAVATAQSTALSTGGGADAVTNSGPLESSASGVAGALSVGITQSGSESKAEANATSDATAVGIASDGDQSDSTTQATVDIRSDGLTATLDHLATSDAGADSVDNGGSIDATAVATSGAGGGGISIDGAASAEVNSVARSGATAIATGGDADVIGNRGELTSGATSTAGALAVGFGQNSADDPDAKLEVEVNAKTDANATAEGIAADGGVAERHIVSHLVISANGLDAGFSDTTTAFAAADQIDNTNAVTVTADATAGALGAAVAIDGAAKADVTSNAAATANAITAGGGADTVSSSGELTATATSVAGAVAAAVGQKTSDTASAKTKVDAQTSAAASATGIGTDAGTSSRTTSGALTIDAAGLTFDAARTTTAGVGDDVLTNTGAVDTTATAVSGTLAAAVTIKGAARADAGSSSTATAVGVDTGGGADVVTNGGALDATASATAVTLNATVSTEGNAIANSGFLGAGTSAAARAAGLSSAGATPDQSTTIHTFIDFNDVGVTASYESVADGISNDAGDVIDNTGAITATSDAVAAQLSASVTGKGIALTLGRAEAESNAGAIEAGNGDDTVTNTGTLEADALASAAMANVAVTGKGLAVAGNAAWDGGTKSTATAVGIDADSGTRKTDTVTVEANADRAQVVYLETIDAAAGNDTIDNSGNVTANATAISPSLSVAVAAKGVAAAVSTASAIADATALRGGAGNDAITNGGVLASTADATAAAANVAVTNGGVAGAADAVWDGGTTAEATATGIAGDGGALVRTTRIAVGTDETGKDGTSELATGADMLANTGAIDADATARAFSAGVAVAIDGVAAATATATANSRAAAIDAGAGPDVDAVSNSGHLTADATSIAAAASVSVTNAGLAVAADSVWDGGTKADARARGIDLGGGGETLTNEGAMDVTADATTVSAAVSVAVSGVAGASATATGHADATAIDASAGNDSDSITNSGTLNATADAIAASASVAVTNAGLAIAADAVWDGGTGAEARARGIDVGAASDAVTNSGTINATADAIAASLAVSVAVSGVAGASATSTADANAAGIDAGDDAAVDTVANTGAVTAVANSTAAAGTVTVTTAGAAVSADAVWDGGTTAGSTARGIRVGDGADVVTNDGDVGATADAFALSAAIAVSMNGAAGAIATSNATADSAALDLGSGNDIDTVTNTGALEANAEASAASAAVSFTANGLAVSGGNVWDGGTRGEASARTIILGGGADSLVNDGALTADSSAAATGISVSVAINGVAGAITAATADSTAIGIDAAGGNDSVVSRSDITATSSANANTISVAGTQFGVSVAGNNAWDGGTHGIAAATGISGGAGLDTIGNSGHIDSTATVIAPSVAVSFTVGGVAAAVSTATATADASAIDGGDDADTIANTGKLDVEADGNAVAVNVALTGVGAAVAADAVWDGGTTASAFADGIRGGAGNDTINNTTAAGAITAGADADATSASVAFSAAGFAGAVSTSTSNAAASAINAGAGDDVSFNDSALNSEANATSTSVAISVTGAGGALASDAFWDGGTKANATAAGMIGGDGNDTSTNKGSITADAASSTTSVSIAASASTGLAAAVVASTSTAVAAAMTGDAGNDVVVNSGALTATTDAEAEGVSVAFSTAGGAIAGAHVDAATRANSTAQGMTGGAGGDTLQNDAAGTIDLDATARARETAVALTLQGMAEADSTSIATARGVGLDGGDDADVLVNAGRISGTVVNAAAAARSITFALFGDGTATADATGDAAVTGMSGGTGADQLANSGTIELTPTASATGQSIAVTVGGVSISEANANGRVDAVGMAGGSGADTITNSGKVDAATLASTTARSISASLAGYSVGKANSTANAAVSGLGGNEDDDVIVNTATGSIDASATADVVATSVTVTVAGAADGEARTRPVAAATGIAGDAGNDTISNDGAIAVLGKSRSDASGTSVSVAGSSSAKAGTEVETTTVGVAGGDGLDQIVNRGSIRVGPGEGDDPWMSELETSASSFGLAGGVSAQSAAYAQTVSTGIDGGDQNDVISNQGELIVVASALSNTSQGSMSIFGSAEGGGQSGAFTQAIGIGGGAGDDMLETLTTLDVSARSRLVQDGTTFSFAGSGASGAALEAGTEAVGLSGGAGADQIDAAGTIAVDATSTLISQGGGDTIFGTSAAAGESGATTRTSGIDGGDGADVIDSAAAMTLSATSNLTLDNATYTFGGTGATGGVLAASTYVDGIAGGAGADHIANSGAIAIDAASNLISRGGSDTTFGGASSSVVSGGRAQTSGLVGGEGDDVIENRADGSIDSSAVTRVTANAVAYTFLGGGSQNDAALTGSATATGIAGDAGNDILVNRGDIRILADAALLSQGGAKTTITGTADPVSTGISEVAAQATGMAGGDGDDTVETSGLLHVDAVGVASAENEASTNGVSIVNGNRAGAVTRAKVEATGIAAGAGTNAVTLDGDVTVTATSTAYALALASGATVSLASDGASAADSLAEARAIGVTGGDDGNNVVNDGHTTVTADATTAKRVLVNVTVFRDIRSTSENDVLAPPESIGAAALPAFTDANGNPITANRDQYPDGTVVFWTQSPADQQDPNNPAGFAGGHYIVDVVTVDPDGPDGPQPPVEQWSWEFVAGGLIQPVVVQQLQDAFPTYAAANGAGIAGEGNGYAVGSAQADALGMSLGDGNNVVQNSGELSVLAKAEGAVNVSSDGDGFGDAVGVANSAAFARAVGFELGAGDNNVLNSGELSVTATPVAQALVEVTGGDVCIWFFGWWCGGGGDGTGTSTASITAIATGVATGGGNNVIVNDGAISVVARPDIRVDSRTGEFVVDVRQENSESTTVTVASHAVGIQTGAGADEIVNSGSIAVEAWDLLSACHSDGCRSLTLAKIIDSSTVDAAGILTGAGNDTVRNLGSVSALVFTDGVAAAAVGIDTGTGNDSLTLGDGSSVTGSVDLGDGDDELTLAGTPVVANAAAAPLAPQGGAGDDTLVLDGNGSFASTPVSFEHARKIDAGTYLLPALNTVQTLVIEQGTLALGANYTFAEAGSFSTYFDTSGDRGQLSVDGTATVDGAIAVEKRGTDFISNGSRYSVVATTGGVDGAFADISLPASLPLLSFALDQTANTVDVLANAASFATVANEPLYRQIALHLDSIADGATGDFNTMLGTMQSMQTGFDAAFASLSPDAHFAGGQGAHDASMQWLRLLEQHLADTRAVYRDVLPVGAAYGDISVSLRQNGIAAIGFSSNPRVAYLGDNVMADNPVAIVGAGSAPASTRQGEPNAQTWALGAMGKGEYDNIDGYAQFDSDSSVIAIGQDFRFTDNVLVGLAAGRTQTDIKLNDIDAKTNIDGWYGSLYGMWFDNRAYVEGGLSYAKQSFDTKRAVQVGPIAARATSDHDGEAWLGHVGAGYQFDRGAFYAEPYAALYYFDTSEDSFAETGAGTLDQFIDNRSTSSLLSDAGARLGALQKLEHGVLDWHAVVAWNHDFDVDEGQIRFAWAGQPQAFFTIDARNVSADSALLGAGVALIGRTTTLALDYRGLFNSDYQDNTFGARVSFRF